MNSISTIQTMLLPPLFLFHSLQIQFHPQVHKKKTQSLEHIWFSSSNHSNWALSATSLPSVRHSRMLLLHLQTNCLSFRYKIWAPIHCSHVFRLDIRSKLISVSDWFDLRDWHSDDIPCPLKKLSVFFWSHQVCDEIPLSLFCVLTGQAKFRECRVFL